MGIEEHDWRDAIAYSSDLADFRLHQGPRFLTNELAPIAVKIGCAQSLGWGPACSRGVFVVVAALTQSARARPAWRQSRRPRPCGGL
jgi:hypothetical protein